MRNKTGYREWKRGLPKYATAEDELGTPLPESAARRRVCRECERPVMATSYWWCGDHNKFLGETPDNEYSAVISLAPFEA